jgi:hypothetical protein
MKKFLVCFIVTQLAFLSCKKSEVEPLFSDSANKRITTAIDGYKKQLVGSEYGWKGAYYPNGAKDGGYSFYLKFDATGRLSMYSDLDGLFTDKAFETTYQVKALQKPTLIFDSYSYLHELVNPDYNGGTGYMADLELAVVSADENKISLVGNVNKTEMILTKLTKAESESLAKGGLANIFDSSVDFVNTDKYLTIVFPTGERADISIDLDTKKFTIFSIKNNNVDALETPFILTTTGIQFKNPLTLYGVTFQELVWDNILKIYYINPNGKRINVVLSSKPGLPFYYALGTLFQGFYMSTAIPSQTAEYKALYAKIKSNVIALSTVAPARVIGNVYLQYLTDTGDFVLVVDYTRKNPDGSIVFDGSSVLYFQPSLDAKGNLSFGKSYQNATFAGGQLSLGASAIVLAGIKPLTDILENNTFQWDYDPTETRIAVLKSNGTPSITIKGSLF